MNSNLTGVMPETRKIIGRSLHRISAACLVLGLALSAGCGKWKSDSADDGFARFGPTVSAHPFLQKWSAQPLEQARAAAEAGDVSAQYYLGWAHLCGLGTVPDAAQALRWFRQAAEQDMPEAQVKTGLFHELGIGTPQDTTEMMKWYEKAADKGYVGAQVRLGMIYGGDANLPVIRVVSAGRGYQGPAVPSDFAASFKWYSLAAEQGFPPAQVELARMLRTGRHTLPSAGFPNLTNRFPFRIGPTAAPKPDTVGYAKWLLIAAARGDSAAKAELAGSKKKSKASDDREARRQADAFLAVHPQKDWTHVAEVLFYLNPCAPPSGAKDSGERFNRILDAAKKGDASAQYRVALCFQHDAYGWDLKTDLPRHAPSGAARVPEDQNRRVSARTKLAGEWYAAAAAQGHLPSVLNLALMYASGRLGEAHRHLALEWFRRAADRGQAEAQFQLAQIHKEGRGVPANYATAVKWYRMAAAQGHAGAAQALGLSVTNTLAQQPSGQVSSQETNLAGASVTASRPSVPTRIRPSEKAIRLAIVPADPSLRAATDVLTALLSQQPDLQLLERSEIDRVFQELALAAASQKDFLKLGQTLGADGLLTLEPVKVDQQPRLQLTLAAVGPGVVLASERYLMPLEDLSGWSALVAKQLKFLFPKLAVPAANALPLSILNLRSPVSTPEAVALDRELTLLLTHRLVREKELFVLERRRMDALEREKLFQGKERAAFWNGSYLLDGTVNKEGMTKDAVTLSGRLIPPAGGEATPIEVSGRRDQLAKLVDELTGKILMVLHRQPQVTAWNPLDEAARYFEEARWGLRWGMFQEAQAAAEAGWALGLHTRDMAVMRIQAYGQQTRLEVQVWHEGMRVTTTAQTPQAGKLEPARRALELFLEHSRAPSTSITLDADWLGMGDGVLSQASRLLEHFHGRYEACAQAADALASLRSQAREVDAFLVGLPASRENAQRLRVLYGAYWQDRPEDVTRFYQELVETGLYRRVIGKLPPNPYAPDAPWAPPRLVSWTKMSRAQASELSSVLLDTLCRSTNVAALLEGHFWKAASAESDYELEDELGALFSAVWEHRQKVFGNETDPGYWPAVEQWLKRKLSSQGASFDTPVLVRLREAIVPEFQRRLAVAKAEFDKPGQDAARLALVDDVRKALRGERDVQPLEYMEKYSKLEFTVEEARELLLLLDNRRKDKDPRQWSLLPSFPLKTRLRAKLPPEEVEAKRLTLVDELRRDLRGETALQPAEFGAKYRGLDFTDFAFKAEEARELLSLAGPFKQRLGKHGGTFVHMESILRHAAAQSAVPSVAVLPQAPAPMVPPAAPPVPPRPGASNVEPAVLEVTRFWALPLKSGRQAAFGPQSITTACFREGKLWLQTDARVGFGSVHRTLWSLDLNSGATQAIEVPVQGESATPAPRGYSMSLSDLAAQGFEVQGDYVLTQTAAGIQKYDLRRQTWRAPATKLPDQTRFFALGDRLYASTEDSILEFDPKTDAIKVLASCRQRPPRTALDQLERLNYPPVFQDAQRRPCVLLAGKVHAYEAASRDWKPVADFPGAAGWEQALQPDGRLLMRPSPNYGSPSRSLAVLGNSPSPGQAAAPAPARITEVKVMDDLQVLRDKNPSLFPAGSLTRPSFSPSGRTVDPFGRGWSAALDDRDLWVLVDTLNVEPRRDTGRHEIRPEGRAHLLLLRYAQGAGRPIAIPLNLAFPPGAVDEVLLNQRLVGSPDFFNFVATPRGFAFYWPPAAGVWYLPRDVLQPALDTVAQAGRQEQRERLQALLARQKNWLGLYDKNGNGRLDPEEEKLARLNVVYKRQQDELAELLRLFPQEGKPAQEVPRR